MNRRRFLKVIGGSVLAAPSLLSALPKISKQELFEVTHFTEPGSFTSGAEGPAVDTDGNLYAVNFARQGTIGKITPGGNGSVFIELSDGSIANGIRFNSRGEMFLADYVNHNVLKVDMDSKEISVFAHEPRMNQPNDLAIGANDILYASDPNWSESTGQLWRIDTNGTTTLLEENMGTTNGVEVSADEKKLYVGESVQRKVWQYDLSEAGEISNKRILIEFPDFGLDGMRCDQKGNLYITRHSKGTVVIVSPEGEIIREIKMADGKNITNLAFGGPDGKTVYCTVADIGNIQLFRTDTPGRSWKLFDRS
ncbi:MAG: SMP-30/gluconolactonase/LRE family protein [Balneolaceae bacterium]|nr:SMP-30/gluconolactonase/LRE family protein [Balneolaceae bacterium]